MGRFEALGAWVCTLQPIINATSVTQTAIKHGIETR
jgi:hypothetical protein